MRKRRCKLTRVGHVLVDARAGVALAVRDPVSVALQRLLNHVQQRLVLQAENTCGKNIKFLLDLKHGEA